MKHPLIAATAAALLLLAATHGDARLAWLVCAPLLVGARWARGWRAAVLLGTAFALEVAVLGHVLWLSEAAERYFGLSALSSGAAALALCLAVGLPAGVLLGAGLRSACSLPGAWSIPAVGVIWAAWESLTRIVFPSYPWVGLAATQADSPSILQLASVAGQAGLSFVLATAGSALGFGLVAVSAKAAPRQARVRTIVGAGVLAVTLALAAHLWGAMRIGGATPVASPLCTIAAVDADIAAPRDASQVLGRHVAVSERAVDAFAPDVLVWPESALPGNPLMDFDTVTRLRELSRRWGTTLIFGGSRSDWDADWQPRTFNSLFRIDGSAPVEFYDKRDLVPFAERWPEALAKPSWIHTAESSPGESAGRMRVQRCEIGLLICFEVERPGRALELAASGANAIVVASNDAQLPARAVATEVREARLRAVETGLPVLRAANRGVSMAIDRYGRELGRSVDGVTVLHVPPADTAMALHASQLFLWACWVAAAVIAVTAASTRLRQ